MVALPSIIVQYIAGIFLRGPIFVPNNSVYHMKNWYSWSPSKVDTTGITEIFPVYSESKNIKCIAI